MLHLVLPQSLLRNSPGHSGWQTTSDSPEGPLFHNPIRQNSEQYYFCVCVYIYYKANEQIAAMWHGLVARLLKNGTHTCIHAPRSPAAAFLLFFFFFTTKHTHTHTHTPNHKAPSVPGLSVHQLMQSAGLGVLIITLLSGGLTKAHSHHTCAHTHTHVCMLTVQSAQGHCSQ